MVASWQRGRDNAETLKRHFYGWLTGPDGPTISELPFQTAAGRWATSAQFADAIVQLMPQGGVLPPHSPSEHQDQWGMWLTAADVDLTQMRFRAAMNASEGGVEHVMRFADSDDFVRWLVGTITPTSTVEQIGSSIEVLRKNAAARPRWSEELAFWERVADPMLELAVAYEQVGVRRREVATARATAATVIADADATTLTLAIKKDAATGQYEQREQRRKDAGMMQRRAQAHRLRMQLRAEKLRASAAEERRRVRARRKECWLRGRWLPVCARRDSPQACFPGSRSAWTPLIRKRLHSAATSNTAGISLPACSLTAVTRRRAHSRQRIASASVRTRT